MKVLPTDRRGAAFTLLELLAAIGLIIVLVAILTAVSQRVRQDAQATQCLSNLRQAGIGLRLYAASSNGEIRSLYGGGYGNRTWGKILVEEGYVPDRSTMRCPIGKTSYSLDSKTWDWQTFGMSMLVNPGVIETDVVENKGSDRVYSLRLQNVVKPASHLLISDSAGNDANRLQSFRTFTSNPSTGIHLRHRGRANAFFVDGHAESLKRSELKELVPESGLLD